MKTPASIRLRNAGEIALVFLLALAFLKIVQPLAGDSPIWSQLGVWLANVFMLLLVWLGLRWRGQRGRDWGMRFSRPTWGGFGKTVGLSLLVAFFAVVAFALGSILMFNVTGAPEQADYSQYAYLQDNLALFVLTLVGVYLVSSFGEELIYRAFLIQRLREMGLTGKAGHAFAVGFSALAFGLVHYQWGAMGVAQTGLMGVVFGVAYLRFRTNLWIVVLAHAYLDTALMLQLYLAGD